jgi:hypothetical protein
LSVEECLRLERLSHAEKIQHWAQEEPWSGLKLPRNVPQLKAGHIFLDRAGNITKMPELIGRPCFGQVTAFLRHGGHQPFWQPVARRWMNSRCMRCPARAACEYVVEERLRATPHIEAAYREWRGAGGREATWKTKSPGGLARTHYRELLRLLRTTVQFTSENDEIAIAHYESVLRKRREKDRDRQRQKRLQRALERARAGEFNDEVEEILKLQRIWRQIRHAEAKKHPGAPRQLELAPPDSSVFDSQVWLAKTRLELRGKAVNDSNTAKEMQLLGFELHRSRNALRDRVRRSLTRVALLERFQLPGRTELVWPKFGHRELREALDFDPFGLAV